MGYGALWNALEEMITELRRKNLPIPPSAISDLQSAKTLLNISGENAGGEILQQIDMYLQNVESFAISEGERLFGKEYADEWLKKLEKASSEAEKKGSRERFVPGVPRNKKWMRVTPTREVPLKEIEELTAELGLNSRVHTDGNVLVLGEERQLRDFVKRMMNRSRQQSEQK
jgi:hypothetical protein